MGQFPQDSVTAGHPTTSQVEDHEAVESDRRMATTFLRLLAISVPIAAVVVYFGTAGRRVRGAPAASRRQSAGSAEPAARSRRSAVGTQSTQPAAGVAGAAAPADVAVTPVAPSAPVPADRLMVQVSGRQAVLGVGDRRRTAAPRSGCSSPARRQTFEVRREIVLTAGDAGGVAVTFNGEPARPLGGDGQVVDRARQPGELQDLSASTP